MRQLASIQEVWKLEPIEGADRIELAHVLGWQCVVKKGEFKEGDLGVYFEIDSYLPVRPEFEFLRASSYKNTELMGEGFRLKTQKFRGQISQGLVFPMDIVEKEGWYGLPEGADVTELLGVRKFEIPEMAMSGGTAIGEFPGNVPHTDEMRIQAMPELLQEFGDPEYYISTKIDGSSHSVSVDENGVHFMGHNYEYRPDDKCNFYQHIKKGVSIKITAVNTSHKILLSVDSRCTSLHPPSFVLFTFGGYVTIIVSHTYVYCHTFIICVKKERER